MVALFILGVGWVTLSYLLEGQQSLIACPSKLIWHLPCPSCGTTRAFLHLLHGEVGEAIWQNANVVPAAVFLFGFPVLGIYDWLSGKRVVRRLFTWTGRQLQRHRWLFALILVGEGLIWIHNIYIGN